MDRGIIPIQKMEIAARNIDKALLMDLNAPRLIDLMNVCPQTVSTFSGLTDDDYPTLSGLPLALSNMTEIKTVSNVPLPPEIIDHFSHVQCHCMMGLFPEISRAWLTVDSDIYIWTYEQNTDLAYFDGINETILCVGLVKPKPGVFHAFIKYLLVLTTATEIIVLGVSFTSGATAQGDEIQLIPDPVFSLLTDGSTVSVIRGTSTGRLFYGTKEGSLFEISYQAESGWFGKRCQKVNLSKSALSFLMPSFLNAALSEEDGIVQIAVDDSRHILYALTEKGSIEVCDLGEKGNSFSRVTKVSQKSLVNQAMSTVKRLERKDFQPIVSISAIEASESGHVNLVAVTQTGVRFYLSVVSLSNQQPNQRPYTLTLIHVRPPPGYSVNVTVRPRAVHMAHYRDRNLLLISNVKDKDVLWCISSDLFPFGHNLMEAYTTVGLDGPALALSEVRHDLPLLTQQQVESPPLIVRQHVEAPKKYVVLTSNSVQIFLKQRPVDVLKQILMDSHGRDTEALKAFFAMQKEDQACATSLILASLESDDNAEIADLATRAFFMFGGEPKIVPVSQTTMFSGTSMFAPNIISTPVQPQYAQNVYPSQNVGLSPQSPGYTQPGGQQTTFDVVSPIIFSSKHNGLYLYLSRILRPIWNRRCVESVPIDSKNCVYQSTITSDDCIYILNNLTALHHFLTLNTQLSSSVSVTNALQQSMYNNTTMNMNRMNVTVQDAQLEERHSLDALKTFVCNCCQIVGLWKILCEHQFHNLIGQLPENQQQILQSTTFRELFLYRAEICSYLIATLVNSYLGDNASVDSISRKLMEVCPLLYKTEDAAFSKANEILKAARSVQNIDEKEEMLVSALQLCKSVAPNINLPEVCKQFTSLKAYKAVIELCVHCAKKIDPDKIAENFSNNFNNTGDQEGLNYYQKRMGIYKEILNMLETIYNEQSTDEIVTQQFDLNYSNSKSILLDGMESTRMSNTLRQVIDEILEYNDEILHIALYEWMVCKQMTGDLIRIDKPSLEHFLKRACAQNQDNIASDLFKIDKPSLEHYLKRAPVHNQDNMAVMDLMWKFYESHNNHAAAAKILNNLASRPGTSVSLKERLAYLARAIMCMRSDKVGYAPFMGVFLRDLEDKMEVAKVQELILDTITSLRNEIPNADEAIVALNSGLYEISQLYESFAEPFNLLECQLAIIQCAGYADDILTENIWKQILSDELRKTNGSGSERMAQILTKVKYLARQFAHSNNCFPLSYIIYELELLNAKLKGDRNLVPDMLVTIDISFERLIQVYNSLIGLSVNDPFWQIEENEFHLPESTAFLINYFLDNHDAYNSIDKRKITSLCQDTVAALLSNLYSKPNSDHIVDHLRGIQAKLSRI